MHFDAIYKLFHTLKQSSDFARRETAIEEIIELDDDTFRGFIKTNISSEKDEEILAYMADMVVKKNLDDRAILILPLLNSHFSVLRTHICGLLGNCEDNRVVDQLIDRLRNDDVVNVRTVAAHSLGRIGDTKAIPELMWVKENDYALDEDGWGVNVIAERAIAEIKKKSAQNN